jgi:hypothetical protein
MSGAGGLVDAGPAKVVQGIQAFMAGDLIPAPAPTASRRRDQSWLLGFVIGLVALRLLSGFVAERQLTA